jgi:ATP-dependent DNA helicase RecQ
MPDVSGASITLTKPFEPEPKRQRKHRVGEIECDEALFERLRRLRRQIADQHDVPAYIIFSDASLREMARVCPTKPAEFRRVPGVGEQKLKDFAQAFLAEIKGYLQRSAPFPERVPQEKEAQLFGTVASDAER